MKKRLYETHEIAQRILAYLVETPGAKDTLEGITGWWLLQQNLKRKVSEIKEAVQALIAKGYLLERQSRNSAKYYELNRTRLQEISVLVEAG